MLKSVADNIAGKTICAFGEACAWPTQSFVGKFKEEFEAKAQKNVTPREVSDGVALREGRPVLVHDHEVAEHRRWRAKAGCAVGIVNDSKSGHVEQLFSDRMTL